MIDETITHARIVQQRLKADRPDATATCRAASARASAWRSA